MQYLNVWAIILGKLLHGTFVTVVHLSVMKHLNETAPLRMVGHLGIFLQIASSAGSLLCLGLGVILPKADYDPSLQDDAANQ